MGGHVFYGNMRLFSRILIDQNHHIIARALPGINLYHFLSFPNQFKMKNRYRIWRIFIPTSVTNPDRIKALLRQSCGGYVSVFITPSHRKSTLHARPVCFSDCGASLVGALLLSTLIIIAVGTALHTQQRTLINSQLARFSNTPHISIQSLNPHPKWMPLLQDNVIAVERLQQSKSQTKIAFYLHQKHASRLNDWQQKHPEFQLECHNQSPLVSSCTLIRKKESKT